MYRVMLEVVSEYQAKEVASLIYNAIADGEISAVSDVYVIPLEDEEDA